MKMLAVWIFVALAIGLAIGVHKPVTGTQRAMRIIALVLVVAGLGLSIADSAGAATPRMSRPAENHDVQCIAGGLGVTGAWLGTLGSIPTTGGLVTAGAVAASVGATVAWYDSCPKYAQKVIEFMNPGYVGFWVARTVWQKLSSLVSDGYMYHSTGRFCVARYGNSVKRCFLWKNLARNQMHQAFRQWLVMYNVPARLYTGQLYVVR